MKRIRKKQLKQWGRQMLSLVLIVALMLGLIPSTAYATGADSTVKEKEYTSEGCTITYKETSTWGNYVNADVVIENHTDSDKSLWQLRMVYDGKIDNIWNADILSSENGIYEIVAKTYNTTIAAGQSVSFGFIAYGADAKPAVPEQITYVTEQIGAGKNSEQDGSIGESSESSEKEDSSSTEEGSSSTEEGSSSAEEGAGDAEDSR